MEPVDGLNIEEWFFHQSIVVHAAVETFIEKMNNERVVLVSEPASCGYLEIEGSSKNIQRIVNRFPFLLAWAKNNTEIIRAAA